ncbi:MAG TPA: EamA family transporter [Plasticicumulans sp.]|nr:EamA family transporter [Plasticicumulans sp.]HNG50038.1 EamA family transporter [Plasticicumulans sp.]
MPAVAAALGAGALWGLAFLAPLALADWSPLAISGGRYLAYALVALVALLAGPRRPTSAREWLAAWLLSLLGNVVYYLLFAYAVRAAGSYLPTLVIGALPVTLAIVGQWREHRPWRVRHLPPLALIVAGLACVNLGESGAVRGEDYPAGVLAAVAALACWTLFGAANSDYLKRHPALPAGHWNNLLGAGLLPVALLMLAVAPDTAARSPADWQHFWWIAAGTGLTAGWAASGLWNLASRGLPVALAGQLIVCETLFASAYAALWHGALPPAATLAGAALLVAGVLLAIRAFAAQPS